ncbi:polysaccharide deacetylase family protein [candidate division KSB1 bacterium]
MRLIIYVRRILLISFFVFLFNQEKTIGQTEIMKWQDGKEASVSLTWDDGSINHFRIAIPMMNERGFPGTFYLVTGNIPGSKYQRKFIGRPIREIILLSGKIPTNDENFFERASAIVYSNYEVENGSSGEIYNLFRNSRPEEAFNMVDNIFSQIRKNNFKEVSKKTRNEDKLDYKPVMWDDIRKFASQGHEFAAHTISHPPLLILDEANLQYEVEKSKEEMEIQLGSKYTFSYVNPGTEIYRKEYVEKRFSSIRDIMPEDESYLKYFTGDADENQGRNCGIIFEDYYRTIFRTLGKEYIMWRIGARTGTRVSAMKEWIDTSIKTNALLVYVFHGIDNIGWQAKPKEEFVELFDYLKSRENNVWIATMQDIQKYIRERMKAIVSSEITNNTIKVKLTHSLDPVIYNIPLTLKTYVSSEWQSVQFKQGNNLKTLHVSKDLSGTYVLYQAVPNSAVITISKRE